MNCRELIAQLQVKLGDPHGDYHTQANLLIQVNEALREISSRSRSVDIKDFLVAVEGQYQYGLPKSFVTMHAVAFNDVKWYPLHPATLPGIETLASWVSSNSPWNFDIWGNSAIEKAVDTVVSNSSNECRVDTAYATVKAGDRILNLSDEQSQTTINNVTRNAEEGWLEIGYGELIGGTRTQFKEGDVIRILSPESAAKTLMLAPAPNRTDAPGIESIWIYYSRLHRQFQQLDLDRENDELELDVELETCLMHRCLYWARGSELGFSDRETEVQNRDYESTYRTAIPHVRRRIKQNISAWQQHVQVRRGGSVDVAPESTQHVFSRGTY